VVEEEAANVVEEDMYYRVCTDKIL